MQQSRTREELKNIFLEALKEPDGIWHRGWKLLRHERNTSEIEYRGINQIYLSLVTGAKHYDDNRWFTFAQVKNMSTEERPVHIRKGEHGYPVEKWFMALHKNKMDKHDYEQLLKKANDVIGRPLKNGKGKYNNYFGFDEVKRIVANTDIDEKHFDMICRNYTVFNGMQIEGIEPVKRNTLNIDRYDVAQEVIENYLTSQKIELYHSAENSAYYSPAGDMIVMPLKDTFTSEEEYLSTLAHECCHSTGHHQRLDRNLANKSETEEYSIEELKAELSSVFLCNELGVEMSEKHISNHKAYIQSWIKAIEGKDGEKILNEVFRDVYEIVDFVKEQGNLKEIMKRKSDEREAKIMNDKDVQEPVNNMEEVLKYLSLKYEGNMQEVYRALERKEEIDEGLKHELFKKSEDFDCVTILSKEYPEHFKEMENPPICLFFQGDISKIDELANTLQTVEFEDRSRAYNVIDMETGDLFIAFESCEKAKEISQSLESKKFRIREMVREYNLANSEENDIKMLNTNSIMDCGSEIESIRHAKEISDIIDRLIPYNSE
ncbi:zincin-like metallopeptidase domain-containing protein [Thomasclavelia sp.]|uniref:zincin-like metallopeptidase domain-containing protein n=1 Tax=Thomasclavelia sp. TaxID=3025757 RepID=UPI0025EC6132|nr:zincin-like metallopeptidase domain-containing protein [Thomasclavelia sp.]